MRHKILIGVLTITLALCLLGAAPLQAPIELTATEQELMDTLATLTVEIEPTAAPVQYLDPQTGKGAGLSIGILDAIAEASGVHFDYIPTEHVNGVCKSEADLYVGYHRSTYGTTKTNTKPYLYVPLILVGYDVAQANSAMTVAVATVDNVQAEAVGAQYPQYQVEQYNTLEEVAEAMECGVVDAAVITLYSFDELTRVSNQSYRTAALEMESILDIGVSTRLPQSVVGILNKAIESLSREEVEATIFAHSVQYNSIHTNEYFVQRNATAICVVGSILLLAFIGLIVGLVLVKRGKRKALLEMADVDSITGLSTLHKFKRDVAKHLAAAAPGEYAIVALDIDRFAYINNLLGYDIGSRMLQRFADYLVKKTGGEMLIARETADVFVLLVRSKYTGNMAMDDQAVRDILPKVLGEHYPMTFSVGYYIVQEPKISVALCIDRANYARRYVKGTYANTSTEYTDAMAEEQRRDERITLGMEQAVEREEFVAYLQPKVSLKTRKIEGAEVLVRWQTASGRLVPPDEFIPLFENSGFIHRLDLYMLEKSCRLLRKWHDQGIVKPPRLSVNLSKVTLLSEGLCAQLDEILKKYNIDVCHLELELTESAFSMDMNKTIAAVAALKGMGFTISMDDFGSGYSTFHMLKNVEVDILKIDRGFLERSLMDEKGKEIIYSIIMLTKALEIESVAEGVETEMQVDLLTEFGCDLAQGYYFARPMTVEVFEEKLKEKCEKDAPIRAIPLV